jgi:hypothetical protein
VEQHPEVFEYGQLLALVWEEIGLRAVDHHDSKLAIQSLENARRVHSGLTARWTKVISRTAVIKEGLARVDYNLAEAYGSDPVRNAVPLREVWREAFGICDTLSRMQPLSWNLNIVHAQSCLSVAGYEEDDGRGLDLDLLRKAEHIWEGIHRDSPTYASTRKDLVVVRRKIAEALEARGQVAEAAEQRRQSLNTVRGYPNLFYDLAVQYATDAELAGRIETKLDARQLASRRERLLGETIVMLRESVADGFRDARRLRTEPALEPLRSRPEWKMILRDIEFPANPFATY